MINSNIWTNSHVPKSLSYANKKPVCELKMPQSGIMQALYATSVGGIGIGLGNRISIGIGISIIIGISIGIGIGISIGISIGIGIGIGVSLGISSIGIS